MLSDEQRIQSIRWSADMVRALPIGSEARYARAAETLVSAMRFARDLCGNEVIADTYDALPSSASREAVLLGLANRLHLLAFVFVEAEQGPGQIDDLISELHAVARGDAPRLLATVGNRRIKYRLLQSKFGAIRWDAYLKGLQIPNRHEAIADSYGYHKSWDTVSRWKGDAISRWGESAVLRRLQKDENDAVNGLRRWSMGTNESWPDALRREGALHQAIAAQSLGRKK
jgi:hypothetical protein